MKILYHLPSYHSSFFEREALIRRGHSVDIFVPPGYPEKLLWDETQTFTVPKSILFWEARLKKPKLPSFLERFRFVALFIVTAVIKQLWLISLWKRYDVVYIFGRTEFLADPPFLEKRILKLVKKGKIKFRMHPAGCRDEALKSYWKAFDGGSVCGSCFFEPQCQDSANATNLARIKTFQMKVGGNGSHNPPGLDVTHFRIRSVDLGLWNPNLEVPPQYLLPETENVRVLHSFASNGRGGSVNIKGSNYVEAAVQKLRDEGYPVELISVTDLRATEMRFVQAQCDIIVDQLIYGWWGSTALEGVALGKPVLCYLRPSFLAHFLTHFPEFDGKIPIVSANVTTVVDELRVLLDDPELRTKIGRDSREFAEQFVDPDKNVIELENFLK